MAVQAQHVIDSGADGRLAPPSILSRSAGVLGRQLMVAVRFATRAWEVAWGLVTMMVVLSLAATVPVLQFASLGYLLRLSADVARAGRVRAAFRDLPRWAHLGGVILAAGVLFLPLLLMADFRDTARLLDHPVLASQLGRWLLVATPLWMAYVSWALFRGGRVRHFLWPAPRKLWQRLRRGGLLAEGRDRTLRWLAEWRLVHHLGLGLRGFGLACVWLAVPVSLMVWGASLREDAAALSSLAGGLLLAWLLFYLPFLQVNFALDNRWSSGFDVRRVRAQFRQAPLAFWAALTATVLLAVPLYALKAELIPREAAWLPSLVFVASILPARLITGWAVGRSRLRSSPRQGALRWLAWLAAIPAAAAYSLVIYLTQFVCWYGAWSLYEQHAFLLPVPFMDY